MKIDTRIGRRMGHRMDSRRAPAPGDLDRIMPLVVGGGLIAIGAALWRFRPALLALPDPTPIHDDGGRSRVRALAQHSRDKITRVMPENVATSLSRSLLITGLALILVRLLDEIAARGTRRN